MKKNTIAILTTVTLLLTLQSSRAGSATWNLSPTSGDWNTPANWTPATVPNGVADVATFGVSSVTTVLVAVGPFHPVAELVFEPGASAFTFDVTEDIMEIEGAGITNSSGATQTFAIFEGQSIGFHSNATAGDQTSFILA